MNRRRLCVAALFCLSTVSQLPAQDAKPKPPRNPTVADLAYDDEHSRQTFDFWEAEADKPTPLVVLIHGGGWVRGDKSGYSDASVKPYLDAGISVAAVNYRFILQAMEQGVEPPVKACLFDAARAIQTLRFKAKEWNIDPTRVGANGGSAGACTSLWLALHDDLADPHSDDPIARQSTRLTVAAVDAPQSSLDPQELREWMPNAIYGGHAFGFAQKGRSRAEEFDLLMANREKVLPWIKEYSPIEHVSADDPPIFMSFSKQKEAPVLGKPEPDPTHSSMYGIQLAKRLEAVGVEVIVSSPSSEPEPYGSSRQFLIQRLSR